MTNDVAENVLATIGTVLWCIQLVPQIVRNYRTKDCTDLPSSMMFLWALSGVPFAIYFFATDGSVPLRVQPQLFTLFSVMSWTQCLYYPPVQLPWPKVAVIVGAFCVLSVGVEVGLIVWLRPLHRRGIVWPMLVVGIVASVLLALGLVPPYFELAKRRGRVVGINFVFLALDSAGALFSLLSIVVGTMDIMSLVLYAIVMVMELGIFASNTGWYLTGGRQVIREEKAEKRRKAAAAENDSSLSASEKNQIRVSDSAAL